MASISITGYTEKQFRIALKQLEQVFSESKFHPVELRWEDEAIVVDGEEINDDNFDQLMETIEAAIMPAAQVSSPSLSNRSTTKMNLTWNGNGKCWMGVVTQNGKPVRLYVDAENSSENKSAKAALANNTAGQIGNLDANWKAILCRELFARYISEWAKSNPLSESQFKDQLALSELRIDTLGWYWIYYDSGTLFESNVVVLTLNSTGNMEDVRIG